MAREPIPARRKATYAAVTSFAVFSLAVALAETWGALQGGGAPGRNVVESWRLNHIWRPSSSWVHREWQTLNAEWGPPYTHHYNAQSWLETYEVDGDKPENTFRVFYLGDSFTEGTVAMDRSLPSLVEAALEKRAREVGAGIRVEVINTGTISYSPLIYYLLLRYKVLQYDPDLVVINIDMTDDFDDWKYGQTAIFDEQGDPIAAPPRDISSSEFVDTRAGAVRATWATRAQLWLYEHSHFYRYIVTVSAAQQPAVPSRATGELYPRWAWCRPHWDEATQAQVRRTLDYITRIAKLLDARGVRLMLASVPHYPQYAGRPDGSGEPIMSSAPHRIVGEHAARLGVPYLDSHEALAPRVRGTPQARYYYRGDMHFNPDGYALWAEAQVGFLLQRENNLLPAIMTK